MMDNSNLDNLKLLLNLKKLVFRRKYNFQQKNLKLQKQNDKELVSVHKFNVKYAKVYRSLE